MVIIEIRFLLLGFFLALGSVTQLLAIAILLFILFSISAADARRGCWPMLRRMRWFLLSIIVIYLWMTPGQPVIATSATLWWMPTIEGLMMASQRIAALLLMVVAVHWLMWATPRDQLVSALYWLAAPLAWIGFPRQRFAVRLVLVLEAVTVMQVLVGERVKGASIKKGDINAYANKASALVADVVNRGEQTSCHVVEIDVEDLPDIQQWAWPVAITVLMLLLDLLV